MYIPSKCSSYLSLLSGIDCISQETAPYTESQKCANSGTSTTQADPILLEPSLAIAMQKALTEADPGFH